MATMITKTCEDCSIEFEIRLAESNRGGGKYCSRACAGKSRVDGWQKKRDVREDNCSCASCNISMYKKPSVIKKSKSGLVYCSRKCQEEGVLDEHYRVGPEPIEYLPHRRTKLSKQEKLEKRRRKDAGLPYTFCDNCKKYVHGNLWKDKTNILPRMCSKCKINLKIKSWLDGEWDGSLKTGDLSGTIKNYLVDEARHACTKCRWSTIHKTTGKVPLAVDHINGDPYDHRPENLKVLCPNCHALTPTYGSLNTGNGRVNRIGSQKKTK